MEPAFNDTPVTILGICATTKRSEWGVGNDLDDGQLLSMGDCEGNLGVVVEEA